MAGACSYAVVTRQAQLLKNAGSFNL